MTHITLFFTRGNSLAKWHSIGSFEREVAFYKALQMRGIQVSFITYGKPGEEVFSTSLPGIEILYNRWNLPLPIYEILIPLLHARLLKKSDVYKTNQVKGAHPAIIAGWIWNKTTIIRLGYIWSKNLLREKHVVKGKLAVGYENFLLKKASHIVVTTHEMKHEIQQRIKTMKLSISTIPNYVNTELFSPRPYPQSSPQIIYIGRLSEDKNVNSLIEAVAPLNINLRIIGSGPQENRLRDQALRIGGHITFTGSIPNEKLPREINQASIFVLPSFYEGHPKALLEAMSCGVAVIGTNVDGIRELIKSGETGWLCETNAGSLRAAIQHLLADPDLCKHLGKKARSYITENYSLDKIVNQEVELYTQLLQVNHA